MSSGNAAALRRRVLLSGTMLVAVAAGYGRRAYGACVNTGGSTFQCSGAEVTPQAIIANNAAVSTLPGFSVTTWGWLHVLGGIVVLLAGIGLFTGSVLARTVAVIVAMISIILSFLWLPYYPWWSVLIIAFDFVVIWALTFHGRDIVSD